VGQAGAHRPVEAEVTARADLDPVPARFAVSAQIRGGLISDYGSAERRQPPAAACTGVRSSRAREFQAWVTGGSSAGVAAADRAAATAVSVATIAAISSALASPRTTLKYGAPAVTPIRSS
jgi:hypothetical protein